MGSGVGQTWVYKLLDLGALCSLPMIQVSPVMYWNLLEWPQGLIVKYARIFPASVKPLKLAVVGVFMPQKVVNSVR